MYIKNQLGNQLRNQTTNPRCNQPTNQGLSFSKCHAEKAIMNDPKLNQIFDGEEFGRGARLWTSGYDFYTPHKNYVFHGNM